MRKVFVGNLNWDTDDNSLKDAFSEFGEVLKASVVRDKESGRSRGFGFVEFADPSVAEAAVGVDRLAVDGREVRINWANERSKNGGGGSRDRR